MAEHVPPGRAGRLWLLGRLASAQRAVELLDRKRQLLRREHQKCATLRDETRQRWTTACAEAERWGLRAIVLSGTSEVALSAAAVAGRADVAVPWRNTMGVHHPGQPRCTSPTLAPAEAAAANAAISPAAASYRRALEAAVAHAAADSSWRCLGAELEGTSRRLRAIERHRLPALRGTLARLELGLEELEREERVVTRRAQRRRRALRDGPVGPTGSDVDAQVAT